jgi:hypothetical protein
MLYSALNPVTGGTTGNVNADKQVLAGAVITGANGNITTLTTLLTPQGLTVPAAIAPHAAASTYLAEIVWQPGVVGITGVSVNAPPSILYSTLKPETTGTEGNVNAEPQVLAGAVRRGCNGKTTKLLVPGQLTGAVATYVAVKHPAAEGVNTPVAASIFPPPLTVQVPVGGLGCGVVWVKVTLPPPMQEF